MSNATRLSITSATVVMMVVPPGEPTVKNGSPSRKTMVGLVELSGRFNGWTSFGPPGWASKSVSSLLSMNP